MSARVPDPPRDALSAALGYPFRDPALAELALSHPSYAHEKDGSRGNERLEFLGDAVLDLVIAELLYDAHPDWNEGDLTRARSGLVNQHALAERARWIRLDRFVKLGRTEERTKGRKKGSILANCFEAVVGAIYLDGGLAAVRDVIERVFGEAVEEGAARQQRDAKTALQEWAHAQSQSTPTYRTVRDSGVEDDGERFTVEVQIDGEAWGTGVGRSKRIAERAAARAALRRRAPRGE